MGAPLDALKKKWFLDPASPTAAAGPPIALHPGSTVRRFSDGNVVVFIRDGEQYMKLWYALAQRVLRDRDGEIYHSNFVMEDVLTSTEADSGAVATLIAAAKAGVQVYVALNLTVASNLTSRRTLIAMRKAGVKTACFDRRHPISGVNHSKFTVFKSKSGSVGMVGSIDLVGGRWDRTAHETPDRERQKRKASPTHDAGVFVSGGAALDLDASFRDRWNDRSRSIGLHGPLDEQAIPKITSPLGQAISNGTQSVQLLQTFGRTPQGGGYSWGNDGEFTIWAAYLNAIRRSEKYIYIEDQYFFPFRHLFKKKGVAFRDDLIFALGQQIISRKVRVAVVVPFKSEDSVLGGVVAGQQQKQRDTGIEYLRIQAANAGNSSLFSASYLQKRGTKIFVHSKLMICDDELVLIGSANFNQRSMTHDGEMQLGIVDGQGDFAKETRKQLWGEHLERPPESLDDPLKALDEFPDAPRGTVGRLSAYTTGSLARPGERHPRPTEPPTLLMPFVEPYSGPE